MSTSATSAPSITYRQLHSTTLGAQHPLRVIAHCDIDAAYAQFEQVRLKIPPDKPLAVQQWRGLIAVNYPARAFGITRHLDFDEAKKKCPELICVHVATYAQGEGETEAKYHEDARPETHKVSLDPYRRESVKILKIFAESCPTIEKASIDEAFLDFSVPVREILCARYPQLLSLEALQQPGSQVGLDDPIPAPAQLDWDKLQNENGSNIVPLSGDSEPNTWSDVALMIGAELMGKCRQAVFDTLGYTCSAGIATNKMLAKLCSAYKKPNAQTILRTAAVREFLRPFEISKIRFLGGKLGQSVVELLSTVNESQSSSCALGDVWKLSLAQLQNHLGEESGMWVWETVRGIDKSEVEPKTQVKSMMSSKNFRPCISTWNECIHWLRILATDLFARLSEARLVTPGIWPKTIVMHKRDGAYNSSAKQIAFPFTSQFTHEYIFTLGQRLLQEFAVRQADQTSYHVGKITSLCLAFQTLERLEQGQRGIEGFFVPQDRNLAKDKGSKSADELSVKHKPSDQDDGTLALVVRSVPNKDERKSLDETKAQPTGLQSPKSEPRPGSLVSPKKRKKGLADFFVKPATAWPGRQHVGSDAGRANQQALSFTCPRCQAVIDVVGEDDEDGRVELERMKTEHADEHFARDLWKEDRLATSTQAGPKEEKNMQKKKKTPEAGISAFFKPVGESSRKKKK